MGQFLFYYQRPEPSTWVYLSSFLIIGIYFMFHRVWSLRNLDVMMLLLLTPGLMMIYEGRKKASEADTTQAVQQLLPKLTATNSTSRWKFVSDFRRMDDPSKDLLDGESSERLSLQPPPTVPNTVVPPGTPGSQASLADAPTDDAWPGRRLQFWGFVWLLSVCSLILIRMLLDTAMVRRPLLDPNLSSGGMSFISASLCLFLLANILTSAPEEHQRRGGRLGPGYVLLNMVPAIETVPLRPEHAPPRLPQGASGENETGTSQGLQVTAKVLAILANLVLVIGMISVGYWHFGNIKTGIGAATLLLLMPYTAQMNGLLDHMLPGSLLVMAILWYRQPVIAGLFLGLSAGLVYYPFFLLPLWLSFYWQRGARRFTLGFSISIVGLMVALAIWGPAGLTNHLIQMFGVFLPATEGMGGVWGLGWYPQFRLPVLVVFVLMCFSFVLWPAQKNLATLMSCSAAIMTAAQFWHGYGGGLYMAWFLPLVMLTVFRPNLDDRVAMSVVRPISRKAKKVSSEEGDSKSTLAQAG